MTDTTAGTRRAMIETGQPQADLAAELGQTWTTTELQREFEVIGFAAPFVVVRRKSDGAVGSLEFQHQPNGHAQLGQPVRGVVLVRKAGERT